MLQHLFSHRQPIEWADEWAALQDRTRERQRACLEQMIRDGRHVSTGHPVDLRATDVARTFQRVRQMQ